MDAAAAAGGGGGRRRRWGDYLSMSCVELWGGARGGINFCSLGRFGEVTPHNFLPLSSHDFVVIGNSYVH